MGCVIPYPISPAEREIIDKQMNQRSSPRTESLSLFKDIVFPELKPFSSVVPVATIIYMILALDVNVQAAACGSLR